MRSNERDIRGDLTAFAGGRCAGGSEPNVRALPVECFPPCPLFFSLWSTARLYSGMGSPLGAVRRVRHRFVAWHGSVRLNITFCRQLAPPIHGAVSQRREGGSRNG